MSFILEYIDAIQTGEIVTSKRVKSVYSQLANDIRVSTGQYVFDEAKAQRPIKFIERYCKHSKGDFAGKPVKLELFQKAFIEAVFGFVDRETGLRKFKESFFLVGRKNGKTTLLSCLALYMATCDGEKGAEVYTVATKYQQSRILFDESYNMVKQSPELARRFKKRKTDLYYPLTMSKIQPLACRSQTMDGLNASFCVVDELHGITDYNVYPVLQQATTARQQPLIISITTAGTVREGIYDTLYEYASGVADGKISDTHYLPILYELDKDDDWTRPEVWQKANPALGNIKPRETLAELVERAKVSPKERTEILTKQFNLRQNPRGAWLTFEDIENPETFELESFRGSYCIGGVDLSITTDLTAAALLFVRGEKKFAFPMFWLPSERLTEHIETDKIPYDIWQRRGLVRLCEGNTISYHDVARWFVDTVKEYSLYPAWVYYDNYSSRYFVDEMTGYGFHMIRCQQGYKTLSLPLQMLGADLQKKLVNYGNNPVMKWCLSNTGIQTDRNGNIVPIKSQSSKQRIDGLAALLDCYVGLYEHMTEFQGVNSDETKR